MAAIPQVESVSRKQPRVCHRDGGNPFLSGDMPCFQSPQVADLALER